MAVDSQAIVRGEQAHDLYAPRVLGVSLWRLIRVPVIEAHLRARGARGRSNHNRIAARRIPGILAGLVRSVRHLSRLGPATVLIAGFPRRRLEEGAWVDPFSDPLIDLLGEDRTLCVEHPFGGLHCRPPKTRRIVYTDWLVALSRLASSMAFVVPMLMFRREIAELASRVRGVTGRSTPRIRVLAAKAIVRFWLEFSIADRLLAAVRPRCLLLTIRRHHYPLIHACKKRGVRVLELQHGAVSEGGYKYGTPFDPALDPDAFLTFGEYWNRTGWGLPAGAVHAIGYKHIHDRRARLGHLRGDKVMLVSQPHISRALGAAFGAIVKAHPGVCFMLKLHPQDVGAWPARYPFGHDANVEVQADAAPDLYCLFAECRSVIGYDSTVLFEASFFGLEVGILNLEGDNRCAALDYAGRHNFHEIGRLAEIDRWLEHTPGSHTVDNPFFAEFDEARFLRLLDLDDSGGRAGRRAAG